MGMTIRRSRSAFEAAMVNANCKLFEAIARWVVQDEGYLSMETLTNRIKELEAIESKQGIIPKELRNAR
jgi:hypothetical protein